jgi:hypothetical protein
LKHASKFSQELKNASSQAIPQPVLLLSSLSFSAQDNSKNQPNILRKLFGSKKTENAHRNLLKNHKIPWDRTFDYGPSHAENMN